MLLLHDIMKEVTLLGSVQIDLHKKEREYKHLTLSDENVVRYIILYRNKVDVCCGANINVNIFQAGDTLEFNQELICLYASLDKLIDKLRLKEKERKLLELIFEGNTISDIINNHGYARKTAYRIFNKVVETIVEENNRDWRRTNKVNT